MEIQIPCVRNRRPRPTGAGSDPVKLVLSAPDLILKGRGCGYTHNRLHPPSMLELGHGGIQWAVWLSEDAGLEMPWQGPDYEETSRSDLL